MSAVVTVRAVAASHYRQEGARFAVSTLGESAIVHLATLPHRSFEAVDLALIGSAVANGHRPWQQMGRRLQQLGAERVPTSARVTDKNLSNHYFLEVINMLARRAPMIYCKRDAPAVAWSCFSTRFTRGNTWSYDLASIAHYQGLHADMMTHWLRVLPEGRILEVGYEQLVSQPDVLVRQILAHVGLPFEAACLTPRKVSQPVATASLLQVRRPIYTDAMTRWRRYAKWLPAELRRGASGRSSSSA